MNQGLNGQGPMGSGSMHGRIMNNGQAMPNNRMQTEGRVYMYIVLLCKNNFSVKFVLLYSHNNYLQVNAYLFIHLKLLVFYFYL